MSDDAPANGNGPDGPDANDIERELQRIATTLRQIADAVDRMRLEQLGDLVHLIAPTEELFRAAASVFQRPFGR